MQKSLHTYTIFGILLFIMTNLLRVSFMSILPPQGVFMLPGRWGGIGLVPHINKGVAFGIGIPLWLSVSIGIALICYLLYIFFEEHGQSNPSFIHQWSLVLIVSGACGNIFERIVFGYVFDYIHVFGWPVFNLADSLIVIGVIGFLWYYIRNPQYN